MMVAKAYQEIDAEHLLELKSKYAEQRMNHAQVGNKRGKCLTLMFLTVSKVPHHNRNASAERGEDENEVLITSRYGRICYQTQTLKVTSLGGNYR